MDQAQLRQTIMDFLNGHRKAIFGILDKEGLPTTSLMLYIIDDDLNVYFGTRKAFAKYEHVKTHPVVSLSVIEEALDPLKAIDIRGEATEVPTEELLDLFTLFKKKNPSKYYVEGASDFTMFKIKPHFMRWLDAESGTLERVNLEGLETN